MAASGAGYVLTAAHENLLVIQKIIQLQRVVTDRDLVSGSGLTGATVFVLFNVLVPV